jgi:hypothetical protein
MGWVNEFPVVHPGFLAAEQKSGHSSDELKKRQFSRVRERLTFFNKGEYNLLNPNSRNDRLRAPLFPVKAL